MRTSGARLETARLRRCRSWWALVASLPAASSFWELRCARMGESTIAPARIPLGSRPELSRRLAPELSRPGWRRYSHVPKRRCFESRGGKQSCQALREHWYRSPGLRVRATGREARPGQRARLFARWRGVHRLADRLASAIPAITLHACIGPASLVARTASPVALHLVEEVVDDVQFSGTADVVVDVFPNGEVEDSEPKRREHEWPIRRGGHPPADHVVQRPVHEIAIARELFGEMGGGVGLEAMLHVINDIS